MATVDQIIGMLGEQRRELQEQLDAVDRAIAALNRSGRAVEHTPPIEPDVPAEQPAGAVLPRRLAPRRVLSEAHKQALIVGTRKARHAKAAAKGLARELPVDSFVPAIGTRGDRQPPRLVKHPTKT